MTDPNQTQNDAHAKEQKIATEIEQITGGVADAIKVVSKVNAWTAILGFFTALPGLTQLALQIISIFKTTPAESIQDIANAMTLATKAKTVKEREDAAKALASSLNRLS